MLIQSIGISKPIFFPFDFSRWDLESERQIIAIEQWRIKIFNHNVIDFHSGLNRVDGIKGLCRS